MHGYLSRTEVYGQPKTGLEDYVSNGHAPDIFKVEIGYNGNRVGKAYSVGGHGMEWGRGCILFNYNQQFKNIF